MIATVLLTAIVVGLILGYFLHGMTMQRNLAVKMLEQQDEAMRKDARRMRVLRDDHHKTLSLLGITVDSLTFARAENARLQIELAESRHALAVQIAAPEERMALLGNNVVPLRKASR